MARAFDQIYAELGSAFDPSAQLVQQQIDAIPGSTEALVKQADAKKDLAFTQITDGARRRGMGFSGIPLAEQAQYASTEYAPAIANVKSQGEGRRVSLVEALNGLNRDRRTQAQGIYDNEMTRDLQERQFQEQIRQFNEQQAAAAREAAASRAAAASSGGGIGDYLSQLTRGSSASSKPAASYGFKNGKSGSSGFYFKDGSGQSISAAKYAALTGASLPQLISKMAQNGDKTAASILKGPGVQTNTATFKKYFGWDV